MRLQRADGRYVAEDGAGGLDGQPQGPDRQRGADHGDQERRHPGEMAAQRKDDCQSGRGDAEGRSVETVARGPERAQLGQEFRRQLGGREAERSEEHTSELQSLMRISYAVFCLKKKNSTKKLHTTQ